VKGLATITERSTLIFERYLPGPIERVWSYLTDPQLLTTWFSGGVVTDCVGGEVCLEIGATGRVTAYKPPHLLEYTWNEQEAAVGPVANALVRWELSEEGSGVRLKLTHSRLPENEVLAHGAGWHAFLQRLDACINGRDPEPVEKLFARFTPEYIPVVQAAGIATPSSAINGGAHVS
jgi:uncharacterized protein YndB with AHSA1/START domain